MSDTGDIYKSIADLPLADTKTGDELVEVLQGGKSRQMPVSELNKFDSFDVAVQEGPVLSTDSQCYTIENTAAGALNVVLPSEMPANRARIFTIVIYGTVNVPVWDPRIYWTDKRTPVLSPEVTVVTVLWDGKRFHGGIGIGY